MRTRSRYPIIVEDFLGTSVQKTFVNNVLTNTQFKYSNPPTFYREFLLESMTDDPSKGRQFKAVRHTRQYHSKRGLGFDDYHENATTRYETDGPNAHWQVWGQYGLVDHSNLIIGWPETDDALIRKALDQFYSVNEVDSLLNIVESPSLITSLISMYNRINVQVVKKVPFGIPLNNRGLRLGRVLTTPRVKIRSSLKNHTAVISGGYLYYQFGVAPLISDMRKLSKQLEKMKARIANHLKRAGTEVTVHQAIYGDVQGLAPSTSNSLTNYGSSHAVPGTRWSAPLKMVKRPIRTVTVRGIRDQRYEGAGSEFFSKLDFLISRFGATGPASYAWERVPFSFVVDWFIDLSGAINKLDNALTGTVRQVTDACISTAYEVEAPVIHHSPSALETCMYDGSQVAMNRLSLYTRDPFTPTTTVGLSGRFGKKQGGLTAALLAGYCANLKAKR